MTKPILIIEKLNAYRGYLHVLHDIDLEIYDEPVGIIGRNGMGKTTLCAAIMGLVRKKMTGSIKFLGKEISGLPPNVIVDIGISYVPQGRRLFCSLTVDEHLSLAANKKKHGYWDKEKVYSLFPELNDKKLRLAGNLSGGEQQMVSISRALISNPKLIIMDEPSEGLAPILLERVIDTIKLLGNHGIGVLLVEQNLHVATNSVKDQSIMVNGRIVTNVSSKELIQNPELHQKYLGVCKSD